MNLDKLTVNIRPLPSFQAMDLGIAMARVWFGVLWGLWWRRVLPVVLLLILATVINGMANAETGWLKLDFAKSLLATLNIHWGWWLLLLWWLKPYGEMLLVLYLGQKLFDDSVNQSHARAMLCSFRAKDTMLLLTRYRFGFRRQLLLPILLLERPDKKALYARLQILSQRQNNAITWHTLGFLLLESALFFGMAVLCKQLLPETWVETLPLMLWFKEMPYWLSGLTLGLYLLVTSLLSVFYIASGFASYLCKRSALEGWDIEIKFRKLAQRHAQSFIHAPSLSSRGLNSGLNSGSSNASATASPPVAQSQMQL